MPAYKTVINNFTVIKRRGANSPLRSTHRHSFLALVIAFFLLPSSCPSPLQILSPELFPTYPLHRHRFKPSSSSSSCTLFSEDVGDQKHEFDLIHCYRNSDFVLSPNHCRKFFNHVVLLLPYPRYLSILPWIISWRRLYLSPRIIQSNKIFKFSPFNSGHNFCTLSLQYFYIYFPLQFTVFSSFFCTSTSQMLLIFYTMYLLTSMFPYRNKECWIHNILLTSYAEVCWSHKSISFSF